ncbi:MAG: YrdB family protein [Anaerolineae bacterium]|nr:YrdB family protein [Anaerolineae bacterium]
MQIIKLVNLLLRFLLELCLLGAVGFWGFQTRTPLIVRIGLGFGLPLVVMVVWAIFLAPASPRRLREPGLLIAEVALFAPAVGALYSTGHRGLGVLFGVFYGINRLLMTIWRQ